ncbi:hypothetical protein GOP47_0003602 [Adiantum capillus-veneris]|uniref:Phosphatidylinositol 4-phosphate 5-kinase n=1 Tax=Adiantum capillus-veneris TaxID=13818 RepID=A0A9D4V6F4_ADICA|nr:hypothetical protein GOP47_0003602 [Adiantum capillus-veneris]
MAPGGLFCMSGPVAHADDEDDDHCGYLQIQQGALFQPLSFGSKKGSAALQEPADKEDSGNHRLSDVEFLTDQYSECCVKFQCPGGTCKMLWSSGAGYKGEVLDGNLHGLGTYTGADGTVYDGNWILNKKHGFGKKKYVTGDVYEGSWKWDMPEGQGHYLWNDGSEYCGEWRKGLMSGIGVLTWAGGDSYDGQWLNGLADGHGVYTWADGSVYMGTWKEGLKVGPGRYFSPGRKSADDASMPAACMSFQTTSVIGDAPINSLKQSESDSKSAMAAEEDCHSCHDYLKNSVMLQESASVNGAAQPHTLTAAASPDKEQESLLILERLQKMDSTISLLKFEDATNAYKPLDKRRSSAFCREQAVDIITARKSDFDMLSTRYEEKPGQVVDESHRSYNLVTALQLGIRYSVLEASSKDQGKKLSPSDFGPKAMVKVNLPKGNTQHSTDYLDIADFQWIDYCPTVFRQLRGMSKIVGASYCQSICGTEGLRELPSPGKSGCLFYLTQDDRFMIKTLRKAEVKTFLKMLQRYCKHVHSYQNTLLTKFFGLHGVKLAGGQKVRVVVMGNVFASKYPMGRIYDLKGSSEGRIANKSEKSAFAPMKDLDLDVVLQLEPSSRQNILEQIDKDCKFLESERIMDYSLLLGLQFKDSKHDKACSQAQCSMVPLHKVVASNFTAEYGDNMKPDIKGFLQDSNSSRRFSFETSGLEQETHIAHLDLEQAIKHGIQQHSAKMFCKTFQESLQADCDAQEVMLYFRIIDILQEYDLGKRLEHAYKSLYFDPLTISAVDPALYSKRFQQLMHRVFVEIT